MVLSDSFIRSALGVIQGAERWESWRVLERRGMGERTQEKELEWEREQVRESKQEREQAWERGREKEYSVTMVQ